jgi:osmoprotectant transport system permease protein
MNLFWDAITWIFTSVWVTTNASIENTVAQRLGEHVLYTVVSVLVTVAIAVPLGYWIGHTGRGRQLAVGLSGAARALPSVGLLTILALALGVARAEFAAVIVFVLLGLPSVLAGAYAGFEAIDRRTIDAARAVGMSEWQIVTRVEIPLGLPLLVGGIRNAALQIVATATLASYVGLGGLGIYIFGGLQSRDFPQLVGGAILVAVLALVIDLIFALVQKRAVPRGVAVATAKVVRVRPTRSPAVVGTPAS